MLLTFFFIIFLLAVARYFVMAGVAYFVTTKWFRARLKTYKIQKEKPNRKRIVAEISWSLFALFIFSLASVWVYDLHLQGRTLIYDEISEYGWMYYTFSIVLMILVHDAYFYWAHRLMHMNPTFYKLAHQVHHRSMNPTPFAAFSFHPVETVLEVGILPVLVFLFPVHMTALIIFVFFMTLMNVIGHLGFEFYPSGVTRHWLWGLNNTSTHHNMHHQYFTSNFGLYFNFWDRLCGTNHPKYHETFEAVCARRKCSKA